MVEESVADQTDALLDPLAVSRADDGQLTGLVRPENEPRRPRGAPRQGSGAASLKTS